jgi:glycosyltransferase involved in cell wall biosynthesis
MILERLVMLLSVIVPVYNVDLYLEECIKSLLIQNARDDEIEFIFINDGSTDRCSIILDEYKQIDERIKVIHQENMGVAKARRNGLGKAIGEYIAWVDPDDFVSNNWFDTIKGALDKRPQVLLFDYYRLISGKYYERKIGATQGWLDVDLIRLPQLYGMNIGGQNGFKVFLKSFYNSLTIPDMNYAEDLAVWHQCLLKVKRVYYIEKSIYIYRYRSNSLVSLASFNDYKKSYEETIAYYNSLKKIGCKVPSELYDLELVNYMTANAYAKTCHADVTNGIDIKKVIMNPYITWKGKMKFILLSMHALKFFYTLINKFK